MAVRYIGSKARVADEIADIAGRPTGGRFVDAFTGTGVVAAAAANKGWHVRVNDFLASSVILAAARLTSAAHAAFTNLGGYEAAVRQLNGLPAEQGGFIWREYSPASSQFSGHERKYFTEWNAARIDAIRRQIGGWADDHLISVQEERVLISDLLVAANRVANTSGTYGCFLSRWTPPALRDLEMVPSPRAADWMEPPHAVTGDVTEVPVDCGDTLYLDPPYTKRQYAAYYHIQETIAYGDAPEVEGKTGLRPWKHLASDFSYRSRALHAITDLVRRSEAGRVLLSYSSEGHVPREELALGLVPLGELHVHDLGPIGRYRPNAAASSAGQVVHEYVFDLRRPAAVAEVAS